MGSCPARRTHFTFMHRSRRRRSTCTQKLALPRGFSRAGRWPVPYLAWPQAPRLTQPGTVSVLCCCHLEQLTCVTVCWPLQPPACPPCPQTYLVYRTTYQYLLGNSSAYIYLPIYQSFYSSNHLQTYGITYLPAFLPTYPLGYLPTIRPTFSDTLLPA